MKKSITIYLIIAAIGLLTLSGFIDFAKYPECYLVSWKCQLKIALQNEDAEAVEYYTKNYINNKRDLFGDNFAIIKQYDESGVNL